MTNSLKHRMLWLAAWLIFEVIALFLAFLSAGGGHGDYLFFKLLFPIPMYFGVMHHLLDIPMMVLLFVQYPIIGLAPLVANRKKVICFYTVFVALHMVFSALVFLEDIPSAGA